MKKKIVTANIQDGRTIASLVTEYGVSTASINNWIRDYRKEFQATPEAMSELELMEENRKLKQKLAEAEKESRSEYIRLGLAHRAARGTSGLYIRKLYGYNKNKDGGFVIDDEQSKVVRDIFRWYLDGTSVLGIIKKNSDTGIASPSGKKKWNKRAIETMLANEKYPGTVILLDLATQEFAYHMKECIPPIITESEFRAVQDAKKMRSNVVTDDDGTHRSNKKYSSKRKIT